MTLPVQFGDIELWMTDFLRSKLPGVYVSRKLPATRRDEMVIVRNDGGPQASVVSEIQRFGINVWATNENGTGDFRAGQLARTVQMHLTTAVNVGPVAKIDKTGGPYAIDDPSGWPIRYMTFEVLHKGTPPT